MKMTLVHDGVNPSLTISAETEFELRMLEYLNRSYPDVNCRVVIDDSSYYNQPAKAAQIVMDFYVRVLTAACPSTPLTPEGQL